MGLTEEHGRADVLSMVITTLRSIRPDVLAAAPDTCLTGGDAVLDSVGFVTLLITLEQNLGNSLDLAASLIEHGTTGESSPFRSVGSLADHIQRLLAAGKK